MTPGYRIVADGARGLLRVTLWGRMEDAVVEAWGEERDAAVRRLAAPPNGHLALYDIVRLELPTQDAFTAIQRYIANTRVMSRRAAVLTGSTIQRLQVRRMSSHRTVGFFTELAAAEEWLFADATDKSTLQHRVAAS